MRYLLDVNVLLAAIWTTHSNHERADAWLKGKLLASCPLTELGFLRISTHPKVFRSDVASARKVLQDFTSKHDIEFLPADLPALKSKAAESSAVTDRYLADLAASKGFKLATLDQNIDHPAAELIA